MPLYEPQPLTNEFAHGLPQIPSSKTRPLSPIQRRYIYWAYAGRIPYKEMALIVGCSESTIWRRIKLVESRPIELLDCEFVQQGRTRNGRLAYFCRYCGYGALTVVTVVTHAYEHLFGAGSLVSAPRPVSATNPLDNFPS